MPSEPFPRDVVTRETPPGDNAIAVLRLNRPRVHNAVDEAVMTRLEELLDEIDGDENVLALILTGAGESTFCSGGDLQYFSTLATREEGVAMSRRMQAILRRMSARGRVVFAAVNGDALGGGCEMLTACHFRVVSAAARFSFRQTPNGIITGWGGGVRLLRQLRRGDALRLLLTAETIDAAEALRIGFVDQVAPARDVLKEAIGRARHITAHPAEPVRAFIQLTALYDQRDAEAEEAETELFGDCWTSDAFRRTVMRFADGGR